MSRALSLLPAPSEVAWSTGEFVLTDPVTVSGGGDAARVLTERLEIAAGVRVVAGDVDPSVVFETDGSMAAEAYQLVVDEHGVLIRSSTAQGAGWGVQTLLQLLPSAVFGPGPMEAGTLVVPFVTITDAPRFRWRGALIDVARHFLPMDGLLKHLDVMAMHKLNVLHLHLTDDQGWRMPVSGYPRLTEIGGWRPGTIPGRQPPPDEDDCDDVPWHDGRRHGGSYTAEEIGALVARARMLGITVVPEIDMPGHMEAAIAAYPWLGACSHVQHPRTCWGVSGHVLRLSPETFEFCRDVLDAAMELFPDSPVHIGGDECPGAEWFTDPVSRRTLAQAGADDARTAQSLFEREMIRHVLRRGRRVIAWDETLDGDVPADLTVMVWRDPSTTARAAARGHEVIAAPAAFTYLDRGQYDGADQPLTIGTTLPLETVAQFGSVLHLPDEEGGERLIGGQFQLWTEYVRTWPRAENQMWPRGSAVAQQLWAGTMAPFTHGTGLDQHLTRLTAAGVDWCRPPRAASEAQTC